MDEFVEHIDSNKVLLIEAPLLNLTNVSETNRKKYFDSDITSLDSLGNPVIQSELIISGIKNLTIKGTLKEKSKIVTSYEWTVVLGLNDCRNITLENIELGHHINPGLDCSGEVLEINDCNTITITNSRLFGCGTIGIASNNLDSLVCTNIEIDSCCTGKVMQLDGGNMYFKNCNFHNNHFRTNLDGIYDHYKNIIDIDAKVIFEDCLFYDNYTANIKNSKFFYFSTWRSSQDPISVLLRNCTIKENNVELLSSDPQKIAIENCQFEGNLFDGK